MWQQYQMTVPEAWQWWVHSYGSTARGHNMVGRIITVEDGQGWFREFNSIMIIEKPIGATAASAVTNKTNFE
jgi:hypothetical protein